MNVHTAVRADKAERLARAPRRGSATWQSGAAQDLCGAVSLGGSPLDQSRVGITTGSFS